MNKSSDSQRMEKIVSLCKRRGFIFQSSEIYGGLNGAWDYGPIGVELKRNLKNYWWRVMVHERDDVVGMDGSILMNRAVWKASGHEDTFSDPMCDCLLTKKRFRADQIEPQSGIVYHYTGALDLEYLAALDGRHGLGKGVQGSWVEAADIHAALDKVVTLFGPVAQKEVERLRAATSDRGVSRDSFAVLLPAGKPPESARKVAKQFYQLRGLK